jgi:anti-sigma regulatory factor (Ser/Thr protein kinase)
VGTQEESRSPGSDRRLDIRVSATPEEVSEVRVVLGSLGLPVDMLADARLLVTELLSNSIRHSGLRSDEHIRITAGWSGRTLLVTVHDRSRSSPPSPLAGSIRPSPGAESGWGLYLVDRIASRWGTILSEGDGYWFELELKREPEGS